MCHASMWRRQRYAAIMLLAAALATADAASALARGGHGGGRGGHAGGHGIHLGHGSAGGIGGGSFARGGRNTNDKHVHAASDELDKLLNTRMKNICRGC